MASGYEDRPWLRLYPPGVPADLPLPTRSALDVFRDTVQKKPDAPYLYYFDTVLSFREVDEYANALAAALLDRGIQRGDRVALALQNVPAFPIAVYAAWKCGAILLPVNPMLRHDEIVKQFRDAGPRVLISLESLLENNLEAGRETGVEHVISVSDLDFLKDEVPPFLANVSRRSYPGVEELAELYDRYQDRQAPYTKLEPEEIACLIYTSGTTGPAKGAMNTHGNIVYNCQVHEVWQRLETGDVILGGAPLFHVTGLVQYVCVGAYIGIPIILSYRFDAGEILRLQDRWGGTFTVMASTAYIALLNHPHITRYSLARLQKAYSGGAPIPLELVNTFAQRTGVTMHPSYGLTETTAPSHSTPLGVTPPVDPEFGTLSAGMPLPGTHCRVVDLETGDEVLPRETGEICIKSPTVVPGYWKKPEESALAIRDGWLHTGDVGTMDEQGWFYVVDRVKDLIIASGYKVWPREVEEALFQHPAVRETAVIGVPDSYRGETVKAYVALKAGSEASEEELIQFCRKRLAAYKVPRMVEFVKEVPKTATGKFSRRTLRETMVQPSPQTS